MIDDPRPTNGDGRYVTWKDWGGQLRPSISREIETAVAGVGEDVMAVTGEVSKLRDLVTAAPDGEKPGGILWQLGAIRTEQRRSSRNIVLALGAASFLFNMIAPWLRPLVEQFIGSPRP